MKQRNLMKKTGAFLLAAAMAITAILVFSIPVFAEESDTGIDKTKFATVEELKSFNTDDTSQGEDKNPARVYFGNNNQKWWIAGSQNGNVTLFAASPLATGVKFADIDFTSIDNDRDYNGQTVYPNHYGASDIRNTTLKNLETNKNYFSESEQKLMEATIVYTNDAKYQNDNREANQDHTALKKESVYYTKDKLYLPYRDCDYRTGNDKYITVGNNSLPDNISTLSDLNNGLRVDMDYWARDDFFWLRAPAVCWDYRIGAMLAYPGYNESEYVNTYYALVPAFELNLSSVIFASAAPAASSGGDLDVQDVVNVKENDIKKSGAFTLRYDADKYDKDLGSAWVSFDKSEVTLTGAKAGTYLVVQNNNGAWAKQVTDQTTSVLASDMGLDSFANCKVWLETTDTTNRITYATLATDGQLIYDLELPPEITFASQHIGYEDISAQTIEMKNIGNAEISNIHAVLTGENADKFTLDTTGMQDTLVPNGITSFTVKPKNDLGAGIYTAQVQVTGETGVSKTVSISFTVCGYEKASVEIPAVTPTDTDKTDNNASPETGDSTNLMTWFFLLLASGTAGVCGLYYKKRKVNR